MFPSRRATIGGDKFRDEFSLAFDGTNDFVLTTFEPDYIHTNATFAMWIKMNDLSGARKLVKQLKDDKSFYKTQSEIAKRNFYSFFGEESYMYNIDKIILKVLS